MKKQGFQAIPFLILISLLIRPVFAESVTTGNATAKSTVETKVEGNGSVTTHIEVEANQEKKVLDANEPGNYNVSVESDSNTEASVDSSSNASSSTPSADPENTDEDKPSFISNLIKNIQNFFKRILDFF